jgi:hypothetical protein
MIWLRKLFQKIITMNQKESCFEHHTSSRQMKIVAEIVDEVMDNFHRMLAALPQVGFFHPSSLPGAMSLAG